MTYQEAINQAKLGYTLMLPNFTGYFKWCYNSNCFMFYNGNYNKPAKDMNVSNRDNFYYIT